MNETDGLEFSYAEKCTTVREQIQLRKQMDGVKKVGEVALHNCGDTKKYPEPFGKQAHGVLRVDLFKGSCTWHTTAAASAAAGW